MTAITTGLLLLLTGCFALPSVPLQRPPSSASEDGGPQDWASLPHCENGPPDPWVLVDDFPTDLVESAGIQAECGDSYLTTDLPAYVSIADSAVSLAELEAFAAVLEEAGYARTESTFAPVDETSSPGPLGGWEYTLDAAAGVTLVYVVTFWAGDDADRYFVYIDVESPATRALAP